MIIYVLLANWWTLSIKLHSLSFLIAFFILQFREKLLRYCSSLLYGRRLRVLQATLDILRPIADILVRIKDQVHRTGHVMLALALAHIVHRAIILVRVIRYMIVFFVARHFVRYKILFFFIMLSSRIIILSKNVFFCKIYNTLYIALLTIFSSVFSIS